MRRRPSTLPLTALLLFGAVCAATVALSDVGSAAAQDAPLDDARVASVRERLVGAADRAEAEGLPRAWIDAKVREGLAKRVPAARIAAAVEQLASRMHDAATVARNVPARGRTEVARAVLDALAVGAQLEPLTELVREVARRSDSTSVDVQHAVSAVAELGERGFEPGLATRSTLAAWRDGGRDALRSLVALARTIPREDARARGAELTRAAESARGEQRDRSEQRGRSEDRDHGRPIDRGGPPHDDAFNQGAARGRGRALGRAGD